MNQLLPLLLVFAWFGFVLWRRSVGQRKRWLRQLGLPGSWQWESGDSVLSLSGELSSGSFLLREGDQQCSGRWRLLGHSLHLYPSRGELELGAKNPYLLDLRRFETGSLGLDGEGRERRIYTRSTENVVPLRG